MAEERSPLVPDMDLRTPAPLKVLRYAIIVFFSLMVLSAVYGGWWYFVASQIEAGIDTWRIQQQARGMDVQIEKRMRSGFPGTIKYKFASPTLIQSGDQSWQWKAEQVDLAIKPWALSRMLFELKGKHQGYYQSAGIAHNFGGSAQKWQGAIDLKNGVLSQFEMSLSGVKLEELAQKEVFQFAEAEISALIRQEQNPEFTVRAREIILPSSLNAPLGSKIAHFDARGMVTGDIKSGNLEKVLVAWRDSGGTLDFTNLDIDYPPLRVRGDGTVALDGTLQPVAALSVNAEGFFATVDALHSQGLIPLGTSFATKIALGVLSKTPDGGGTPYLDLPITVQDRTLYAGSIALVKLRPIRWRFRRQH